MAITVAWEKTSSNHGSTKKPLVWRECSTRARTAAGWVGRHFVSMPTKPHATRSRSGPFSDCSTFDARPRKIDTAGITHAQDREAGPWRPDARTRLLSCHWLLRHGWRTNSQSRPVCKLQITIIGASLSEPHSYVLTWTFVIRDIYIYIYIYKSSVRPLGFVPATIEPKSRANPVLWLCLPLALIDDDFLSKGCRFKSPVLCFLPPLHRCSAALWDKLDLNFWTSVLSFFNRLKTFTHKKSTIGVRNSAFDFGGRWSTDFFRQCLEKVHESTDKTTNERNRILRVKTDEPEKTLGSTAISSSLDRALPSLRHRALLGKSPEIGDISSKGHDFVSIDGNGACRPRLAPQCLHSLVTRECKHCGASLGRHAPFSSMKTKVVPFRGDVPDLWLLAKECTVTQWRQGPVKSFQKN